MIVYDKLWDTMRERNVSQYKLIKEHKISTGQLDRLRKNESVSTYTLNRLCEILHCTLSDIAEYVDPLECPSSRGSQRDAKETDCGNQKL